MMTKDLLTEQASEEKGDAGQLIPARDDSLDGVKTDKNDPLTDQNLRLMSASDDPTNDSEHSQQVQILT